MAHEHSDDQWKRHLEWNGRAIVKTEPDDSYEGMLRFKAISAFCAHEFDDAIVMFDELARLTQNPKDESWRGQALYILGRYADVCGVYETLLQGDPSNAKFLNFFAHIKSTCELDELRDGV